VAQTCAAYKDAESKLRSHFSIFEIFRNIHVHINDFLRFVGGLWALGWAWQTLGQSIDIDETNKISAKTFILALKL